MDSAHVLDRALGADLPLSPSQRTSILTSTLDYVDWFNATVCTDTFITGAEQFVLLLRDVLAWIKLPGGRLRARRRCGRDVPLDHVGARGGADAPRRHGPGGRLLPRRR